MVDLDSTPSLESDVRFRVIGDEGITIRQSSGEILVVNRVGSNAMERMDGSTSLRSIVDALETLYDVDRTTLERDILALIEDLLKSGLIRIEG